MIDADVLEPELDALDLGYVARPQFESFHARQQRWGVIVAHRRAGKTVACVMDLIDHAVRCEKIRPRFAYMAPLYRQAKQVAWDYVKQYGLRIPGATASESELRLDLPSAAQVRLFGADNPDALRGMYLDGVILDEAADMSPRLFSEVIRPALSDRLGWAFWIGTPKGQNDFYDLIYGVKGGFEGAIASPDWFYLCLKASETGILPQEELESAKRSGMSPEQYAQEFECSFQAAIMGAYYGHELEAAENEDRLTKNVYDRTLQVHTAWDLGHSDATAIWFYQQQGFEIRIIDFYFATGHGLNHYVTKLQELAASPGNIGGYVYGRHYLPHDVEVKELGSGKTRIATLRGLGLNNIIVVPKLGVDEGINAVRKMFPRCWFDKSKCADGIKALRQYRREYDDVRKTFYETPFHDWSSDPSDAFRYLAIGLQDPEGRKGKSPKVEKKWIY
jgi:phage terminase large subunit